MYKVPAHNQSRWPLLCVEKVNACDETIAVDPGSETIASIWSPTSRALFLERDRHRLHVLRERKTTMKADEHAYKTISITSRHT